MKNSRRTFLKFSGLSGIGILSGGIFNSAFGKEKRTQLSELSSIARNPQHFNMCGYAAPKLDTVRTGFIGIGARGPAHLKNMGKLEGVEIKAVCDIRPEFATRAQKLANDAGHHPAVYSGKANSWKELCDRDDIDLIFIATPWDMHTPMAVYAMKQGKHVCIEVPAAVTIDECWELVETSEQTKKHCMMMENCCYDFFELLTLNMARQGFFGEIVHTEGAYLHNLLESNFDKDRYYELWRLRQNARRNGNLYPTHGLGPICQIMNINRGDKMEYLVSLSGKDFSMADRAKELAEKDTFFEPYAHAHYRGNMNTTNIFTNKGKTIMVQHDVSSPNVYSRIHRVTGTKGTALKYPRPGKISNGGEDWLTEGEMKEVEIKYQVPIVKKVGALAKQIGGHGGMDFLMDWRTIDCLRNGLPFDQDVYDAALWSVIFPLSELSVANRAATVDIPDFTRGSWKKNAPIDILLEKGGTTGVRV